MRIQAPVHSFASDNVAGAHPAVLEAVMAANTGSAAPYGADPWTARAVGRVRDLFDAPAAEVLFTYGGTGANVVAFQSVLDPHEAVICPATAHINTDECGAAERFTGAKLLDVRSTHSMRSRRSPSWRTPTGSCCSSTAPGCRTRPHASTARRPS